MLVSVRSEGSTLLTDCNAGDIAGAESQFAAWDDRHAFLDWILQVPLQQGKNECDGGNCAR